MSRIRSKHPKWFARSIVAGGVALASLAQGGVCLADDAPAKGSSSAESASPEGMVEARKQFQAGVSLLDDPDGARYEDAFHAFKKAYELSRSPKVLGNIGFCALKLERDGEAIDAYTAYLREARDIDERERTQIERDLATLSASVARVTVTSRRAGKLVVVDTRTQTRGSPIVNTYAFEGNEATLRVRPGRHSLRLKGEDVESIAWEGNVEPASQSSHELTFAPPVAPALVSEGPKPNPSYAGPVVLGILGVAAVGVGTVTGLMARSKTDDIESKCPGDVCPFDYDFRSDSSSARTLGTVADATFIGGGVAVGTALIWALLIPRGDRSSTQTGAAPAWATPAAQCTARGCGVQLGGRF